MKLLGSKSLETERLFLHKTEEEDLKKLWKILCLNDVNNYYLTTKINFDWEKEKKWQYKKLEEASNPDVFRWTIELKNTNEVIGQISIQENSESNDLSIRDIGWFISPNYQKKGYCYEAAVEVLKYMFLEVEISSIETAIAEDNSPSWKLIEKIGFKKIGSKKLKYTFIDNEVEGIKYRLTKKDFLKELFRKEELYITENIDKDPYIKHLSDDNILNLTGESGSGKTTVAMKYKDNPDCIVIDTDQVFGNMDKDKDNQELYDYLLKKYQKLPNICDNFDELYENIINYYKDKNKMIIIDSAQFRNMKNVKLLKGDIIIIRTCINTCYQRCINRYKENKKNATFAEITAYSAKKKKIYDWYHALNSFIDRVDRL